MGRPRRDRESEWAQAREVHARADDRELFEKQSWSREELSALRALFANDIEGVADYLSEESA